MVSIAYRKQLICGLREIYQHLYRLQTWTGAKPSIKSIFICITSIQGAEVNPSIPDLANYLGKSLPIVVMADDEL